MTTKALPINLSTALVASKQVKAFLALLPVQDQNKILHELSLIANGYSLEFAPVRNPVIVEWCQAHGLCEPQRFKLMCIAPDKGGIRMIFAFTQSDDPILMYVIKAGYRSENIYGDGK
jgi:hypothetical protein